MPSRYLSKLDFQLAYLILLTQRGAKPLSRWEGPLPKEAEEAIRGYDLSLAAVSRSTRLGRTKRESVFARNPARTALYYRRFQGRPIRHSAEAIRLEGALFGYPSCCVERFVRRPYAPNGLAPEDQRVLFHWACPGCRRTAVLLAEYRAAYDDCLRLFGGREQVARPPQGRRRRTTARIAASLALAAGLGGLPAAARADDPHWIPAGDDQDADYLSFAEEVLRGTDWWNADTDGDATLDGPQTAEWIHQIIADPPPGIAVEEHLTYGVEMCFACGAMINMGFVRITNTDRGRSVDLPLIALHYMEHGGLGYSGEVHSGRVDLAALKPILFPVDPAHFLLPPYEDPDEDGLLSSEEPPLGTDPGDEDTDDDSILDGPGIAEGLLPLIAQLPREEIPDGPYMIEHPAYGLEQCAVCGAAFNMGYASIVNPLEGISLDIPFVAIHSLAHGSSVYDGTVNSGRVLPVLLRTVLTGDGHAHWLAVPGDGDDDGLTDDEEAFFASDPGDPDEDLSGAPDGREMAITMAAQIDTLPEGPLPDRIYLVHYLTCGVYSCQICGEEINMGYMDVVNPEKGISCEVPYYNHHFMEHGSFSTEREDLYPRTDPRELAEVLGITEQTGAESGTPSAVLFQSSPNPFRTGAEAEIALSLPRAAGAIDVTVYDAAGRVVRKIYSGDPAGTTLRFAWDGRTETGEPAGAGIYLCKVRIGETALVRKIALLP